MSSVHSALDARHDALLSRLAACEPGMRPADAFAARAEIVALAWPSAFAPSFCAAPAHWSAREPVPRPAGPPRRNRVEATLDGREMDTWTGRPIQRVPLTAATLARARAFSRADHPALQPVLRVDREGGTIWLLATRGPSVSGALARDERARLAEALDALHAAGGAHGAVDAQHVTIEQDGEVVLHFVSLVGRTCDADATVDGDRQALAQLP